MDYKKISDFFKFHIVLIKNLILNEIDHEYMGNVEELEEAGTPGVL